MGMNVGASDDGEEQTMSTINTTPLVDVMLVLLIILIITIPIMTHGTKLDMPQANNAPPPDMRPEVVDLEIDFDGTIVWNGTVVSGSAARGFLPAGSSEAGAAGAAPAARSSCQIRDSGTRPGGSATARHDEDGVCQYGGIPGVRGFPLTGGTLSGPYGLRNSLIGVITRRSGHLQPALGLPDVRLESSNILLLEDMPCL